MITNEDKVAPILYRITTEKLQVCNPNKTNVIHKPKITGYSAGSCRTFWWRCDSFIRNPLYRGGMYDFLLSNPYWVEFAL